MEQLLFNIVQELERREITGCDISSEYIVMCLDKQKILNYSNFHMFPGTFSGYFFNLSSINNERINKIDKICSMIIEIVNRRGFMRIELDINNLRHCFVIYNTIKNELNCIDTYGLTRTVTNSKFDICEFKELLLEPTLIKWNKIFNCKEKKEICQNFTIKCNISENDKKNSLVQF